jgi:hypothetical protein
MRKYRLNASSFVRFAYGVELIAGLRTSPETAAMADDFEKRNEELYAQYDKRTQLMLPMLKARARFRIQEVLVDRTIRSAARAAQVADGGRRGMISVAIFPDGLKPVVEPTGRGQLKPTRDLVSRLSDCKLDGMDEYRAEWLPRLKDALFALEGAAAAYQSAQEAHDAAFGLEKAMRAQHRLEVDRLMGLVRAAFPDDRAMQDSIFPEMKRDGASEDDIEEQTAPAEA